MIITFFHLVLNFNLMIVSFFHLVLNFIQIIITFFHLILNFLIQFYLIIRFNYIKLINDYLITIIILQQMKLMIQFNFI